VQDADQDGTGEPQGRSERPHPPGTDALYIGCSVGVGGRLEQHSIKFGDATALQSSNKAFGLVACLMQYQNLTPREVGICILRLWNRKDIPYSEVLICSLANSLICQDGFHRIEWGDSTANKPLDKESEEYIKAREDHLHENLSESLRQIEARSNFIQEFRQLQPGVSNEEEHLVEATTDDLDDIEDDIDLLQELNAD
jgi:hypothetical protein